jgi:hypothetical protein
LPYQEISTIQKTDNAQTKYVTVAVKSTNVRASYSVALVSSKFSSLSLQSQLYFDTPKLDEQLEFLQKQWLHVLAKNAMIADEEPEHDRQRGYSFTDSENTSLK